MFLSSLKHCALENVHWRSLYYSSNFLVCLTYKICFLKLLNLTYNFFVFILFYISCICCGGVGIISQCGCIMGYRAIPQHCNRTTKIPLDGHFSWQLAQKLDFFLDLENLAFINTWHGCMLCLIHLEKKEST